MYSIKQLATQLIGLTAMLALHTQAADLSWAGLGQAASRAAQEPSTWIPLATAGVVAAGGWDKPWQRSLGKHQYVFGQAAEDRSNQLVGLSTLLYAGTTLIASPQTESGFDTWQWRASNVAVMLTDKTLVDELVGEWKLRAGRDRPDGVADDSFPSKHNATAASQTTLTRRNLDYLELDDSWRQAATWGLYGLDGLTGLARMEANKHYPSDVLVGMALGNFLANFSFNLFLERPQDGAYSLSLSPSHEGAELQARVSF